jgi:hypothetical protein
VLDRGHELIVHTKDKIRKSKDKNKAALNNQKQIPRRPGKTGRDSLGMTNKNMAA